QRRYGPYLRPALLRELPQPSPHYAVVPALGSPPDYGCAAPTSARLWAHRYNSWPKSFPYPAPLGRGQQPFAACLLGSVHKTLGFDTTAALEDRISDRLRG